MTMPDLKKIKFLQNINRSSADYKPEVIAALLVDQGFDLDQFVFLRKGNAKRGFSKDIAEINLKAMGDRTKDNVVEISVNRRGIYDGLPEGLFHRTGSNKGSKSKQQILHDFNRHREEEFFARRFFCLFEVECDRSSLLAHRLELYYDKKNCNRNFIEVFYNFWPILGQIPLHKAVLFLKMVPFFSLIKNSFEKISEAITILTGVDVNISVSHQIKKQYLEFDNLGLGRTQLGLSFVLPGYCQDGLQDIEVLIGPVELERIQSFLPEGQNFKICRCLADNLFPANKQIEIKYKINQESNRFILGHQNGRPFNYLSINTIIVN